ncbi:MAG TPA: hypothetical protein VNJ04_15430 [Gemmatimonadaceae bacterium]|nr:hypothetical protein [Gemmatimonadaceae bacterium]
MKAGTIAARTALALCFTIAIACSSEPERLKPVDTLSATDEPAGNMPAMAAFSDADLNSFITALGKETEILRAGQERQRTAATPQQRVDALQMMREEARIPEAARAAGMSVDRYTAVRSTIIPMLQTLDFQGKMKGPMTMDTTRVGEETRARLRGDAMAGLPAASRNALTASLSRIEAIWGDYMALATQGG